MQYWSMNPGLCSYSTYWETFPTPFHFIFLSQQTKQQVSLGHFHAHMSWLFAYLHPNSYSLCPLTLFLNIYIGIYSMHAYTHVNRLFIWWEGILHFPRTVLLSSLYRARLRVSVKGPLPGTDYLLLVFCKFGTQGPFFTY